MTADRAPLVSVIMTVYNGEKFVAEAIESILAQTFTDFEFVIVDDGSQDGSVDIVRSFETRDSRIRFRQLECNVGMADARNSGLAVARGEYVAIFDCDDISLPARLQKQVNFMEANPDIGVLGTWSQKVDHELKPGDPVDYRLDHCGIVFDLLLGRSFSHATIMTRRALLALVGGYEPGRRTADDVELYCRLVWRAKFANLPERLVLVRQHEGQGHRDRGSKRNREAWIARARFINQLWGEAPPASLERFYKIRQRRKLGWAERRAARKDITRLIDALIQFELVQPQHRHTLRSYMNQYLELASPRLWQMYCHWRRHHFGRS